MKGSLEELSLSSRHSEGPWFFQIFQVLVKISRVNNAFYSHVQLYQTQPPILLELLAMGFPSNKSDLCLTLRYCSSPQPKPSHLMVHISLSMKIGYPPGPMVYKHPENGNNLGGFLYFQVQIIELFPPGGDCCWDSSCPS